MQTYKFFIAELDDFLDRIQWGNSVSAYDEKLLEEYINGRASKELHKLVDLKTIASSGAYFTHPHLAKTALNPLIKENNLNNLNIFDPTCGAGDLLLNWCDILPVSRRLDKTINTWEKYINGIDLHKEFIEVAKRRIVLKAISKGARNYNKENIKFMNLFPGLKQGDIKYWKDKIPSSSTIVMNPPFNLIELQKRCSWSSGKVSFAAYIFGLIIENAEPNCKIVAILPDVLRSGTRYKNWRKMVEEKIRIQSIKTYGLFSSTVNIDVFVLKGIIGSKSRKKMDWFNLGIKRKNSLGDISIIMVGQVVPHRLKGDGNLMPYITAKDIKPLKTLKHIERKIKFSGSGIKPPFVVVKRTSNPTDSSRLIASIVKSKDTIAVENHLIVLKPLDKSISSCNRIIKSVMHEKSHAWLNKRIRCRHLTIPSLKQLPLWED